MSYNELVFVELKSQLGSVTTYNFTIEESLIVIEFENCRKKNPLHQVYFRWGKSNFIIARPYQMAVDDDKVQDGQMSFSDYSKKWYNEAVKEVVHD